ncbi:3-oxoacyl-(Acyl carrier protein) synthase III (fragment) [Bradyrhizobium sp. ORS 278]
MLKRTTWSLGSLSGHRTFGAGRLQQFDTFRAVAAQRATSPAAEELLPSTFSTTARIVAGRDV